MDGVTRIVRVVAHLEAWVDESFPFAKIKIKILERDPGNLLAVANVAIRNLTTRDPEYISGIGGTVKEATDDLLVRFIAGVRENTPPTGLTEEDFEWSSPEDF